MRGRTPIFARRSRQQAAPANHGRNHYRHLLGVPAISAIEAGYEVQAVMDASGSPYQINEDITRRRMERAGVVLTVTTTVTAELIGNWGTPAGQEIVKFFPVPALMQPVD